MLDWLSAYVLWKSQREFFRSKYLWTYPSAHLHTYLADILSFVNFTQLISVLWVCRGCGFMNYKRTEIILVRMSVSFHRQVMDNFYSYDGLFSDTNTSKLVCLSHHLLPKIRLRCGQADAHQQVPLVGVLDLHRVHPLCPGTYPTKSYKYWFTHICNLYIHCAYL
jgi:hypothetical protein